LQLHATKKAIRALGVAESFRPNEHKSRIAGVVMRADLVVDGFALGQATVGGDDATASVLKLLRSLKRADVNLIMLSGCIISRYNIIDIDGLASISGLPVICLTYNESKGIEGAIRRNFADPEERLAKYKALGRRLPLTLHTGHRTYVRDANIRDADAKRILDSFTLQGGIPEPVRLAKLLARAASASVPR